MSGNEARERQYTLLGSIPEDWAVVHFGDVATRVRRPVEVKPEGVYSEIGVRSHGRGLFHKNVITGKELGSKRVFHVEPDCLVFNIVFAWEGAVALTTADDVGRIASHRFPMFRFRDGVDREYVWRFLCSRHGVHQLGLASPGGAGRNRTLGSEALGRLPLLLPPISEQSAIVRVLEDLDRTVSATEGIIARLSEAKRAALTAFLSDAHYGKEHQESIAVQTPGSWGAVRLGEVVRQIQGGTSPRCDAVPPADGEWGVLKLGAVSCGYFDARESKRLPAGEAPDQRAEVRVGDLLVTRSNTRDLVGAVCYVYDTPVHLLLSDLIWRVEVDESQVSKRFLNQCLKYGQVRRAIMMASSGTSGSMKKLSKARLRRVPIPLPPMATQEEIATIGESFDHRLAAERRYLDQLREAKRGLAQALLSGRVRVLSGGAKRRSKARGAGGT